MKNKTRALGIKYLRIMKGEKYEIKYEMETDKTIDTDRDRVNTKTKRQLNWWGHTEQ